MLPRVLSGYKGRTLVCKIGNMLLITFNLLLNQYKSYGISSILSNLMLVDAR